MKKSMRVVFVLLVVFLGGCTNSAIKDEQSETPEVEQPATQGVVDIDNQQLITLMKKGVILVDIRRPEEWTHGVVPGSKKLTFFSKQGEINPSLVMQLKQIAPTDKPVALICRTGNRTRIGATMIHAQLGYPVVYNVEKGIVQWRAEGREIQ